MHGYILHKYTYFRHAYGGVHTCIHTYIHAYIHVYVSILNTAGFSKQHLF